MTNFSNRLLSILLLVWLLPPGLAAQGAYEEESPEAKAARMAWYEAARFGLFIHWGAYSQLDGEYRGRVQKDPKGEWIMRNLKIPVAEYATEVAAQFNPTAFDADQWVAAAAAGGVKYIVMTTKHHDGFALFDSEVSAYNIVRAALHRRDVIRELADACARHGLKFGVYYSQAQDWYHPGGLAPRHRWDERQDGEWTDYFRTLVRGQVTELFTNYGEIALLWWDSGRATQDAAVADEVARELVKLQPGIIVNPRLGGDLRGDFNVYEQVIPGLLTQEYNELCLTHNRSWSYKPSDTDWKSSDFILRTLIHMASIGGNFLFNVGPTNRGEFPKATLETLQYVGDWLRTNGEAVYGTEASPFYKLPFGEATMKRVGDTTKLYLHVYDWPADGTLHVSGLHSRINAAYTLNGKQSLTAKPERGGLTLHRLPRTAPHPTASVIVLETIGPLAIDPGYIRPEGGVLELTPRRALMTIKPQYDHVPVVVEKDGRSYFDGWTNRFPHPRFKNTGNQAHWKIELPEAGTYRVIAEVATDAATNVVTVRSRKQLKVTLPDTGGLDSFASVALGELKLHAGVSTLTFTGGAKQEIWDEVRLAGLRLELVK